MPEEPEHALDCPSLERIVNVTLPPSALTLALTVVDVPFTLADIEGVPIGPGTTLGTVVVGAGTVVVGAGVVAVSAGVVGVVTVGAGVVGVSAGAGCDVTGVPTTGATVLLGQRAGFTGEARQPED